MQTSAGCMTPMQAAPFGKVAPNVTDPQHMYVVSYPVPYNQSISGKKYLQEAGSYQYPNP